jgi:hypothetical protein
MTFIVETGSGVRSANSYVSIEFVTNYLTERNRATENNWSSSSDSIRKAAIISATDYIEKRYSGNFKGFKKYDIPSISAKASISFSGNVSPSEVITLGDETYTFVSSLTSVRNQVLIANTLSETIDNLIYCINADETTKGIRYSLSDLSRHASVEKSGNSVVLTSLSDGVGGNNTILTTTVSNATIVSFSGGLTGGQSLSFPRKDAFYNSGQEIIGIPDKLKFAVSEYAVRALSSPLLTDPSFDSSGLITRKLEKIGPIETEVAYMNGSYGSSVFTPYPAADSLISPFLKSNSSRVIRG